jgi:hypothetical protein
MPWIKLTSPTGKTQYFNADNIIVFREVLALEAAKGGHSRIWMQNGNAQVREMPTDILKVIPAGLVKLTAPNDVAVYFNPASCTEIGEFVESQEEKNNVGAKTKIKTENEDFVVIESVEQTISLFSGEDVA